MPDTGRASILGTNYVAIYTCIVRYYYQHYTGQRAEIPDSPVKNRTPAGNPS